MKLSMLGVDRILDFQFGSGEAAYHLIVELYDRVNKTVALCLNTLVEICGLFNCFLNVFVPPVHLGELQSE